MKLTYRELLDILTNKNITKDALVHVLTDNAKKVGFEGMKSFNIKHLNKYRVKAIRYTQQQLDNRAPRGVWVKSYEEKFEGRKIVR